MDTIDKHLEIALDEIGQVEPWWSDEDGMFIFEHKAYPRVMHADPDKELAKAGYLRALKRFIEYRLSGELADEAERVTKGRGGRREGAGRPKGEPSKTGRFPADIVDWLKESEINLATVRGLINKEHLVAEVARKTKLSQQQISDVLSNIVDSVLEQQGLLDQSLVSRKPIRQKTVAAGKPIAAKSRSSKKFKA